MDRQHVGEKDKKQIRIKTADAICRNRGIGREKESERGRVGEIYCVCVREKEILCVWVGVCERERELVCICTCNKSVMITMNRLRNEWQTQF